MPHLSQLTYVFHFLSQIVNPLNNLINQSTRPKLSASHTMPFMMKYVFVPILESVVQ